MADGASLPNGALPNSGVSGRTVMVAMDGSRYSSHAFEWFAMNVYREGDTVLMAHCGEHVSTPMSMMAGDPSIYLAMERKREEANKKVFCRIDDLTNYHNIPHKLVCLYGKPGEAIVKAAAERSVDMIVVGTRGLGVIRRTIMGSVSDYILHHARVPVFVCRHEAAHEDNRA